MSQNITLVAKILIKLIFHADILNMTICKTNKKKNNVTYILIKEIRENISHVLKVDIFNRNACVFFYTDKKCIYI